MRETRNYSGSGPVAMTDDEKERLNDPESDLDEVVIKHAGAEFRFTPEGEE